MNSSEPLLFAELPPVVNPSSDLPIRIGKKIIDFPLKRQKDGRFRAALGELGLRDVLSADMEWLQEETVRRLQERFPRMIVEIVRDVSEELKSKRAKRKVHRVRNTSRGTSSSPEVPAKPEGLDFYKPCEYQGLFSNCPEGVDAMKGLTHLAKRVFGYAFALAKYYGVDRVKLTWEEVADKLGATGKGVGAAAHLLNSDAVRLFWFKSVPGSHLGATIRFPRNSAVPVPSSEEKLEEEVGPEEKLEDPRKRVPRSSEESSPLLGREFPEFRTSRGARARVRAETSRTDRTKERLLAPDGEQQLLAEIGSLLGEAEMKKNGGSWRKRVREGIVEIRALRNTIEDFKSRASNQSDPIRHSAKWFTDRYRRNLVEIDQAEARKAEAS